MVVVGGGRWGGGRRWREGGKDLKERETIPFDRRSGDGDGVGHIGGGGSWWSTMAGSWVAAGRVEGGDGKKEGKIGEKNFRGRKKMESSI
jgi:hypothetical protein